MTDSSNYYDFTEDSSEVGCDDITEELAVEKAIVRDKVINVWQQPQQRLEQWQCGDQSLGWLQPAHHCTFVFSVSFIDITMHTEYH